jgi:hypothetical protein
MLTSKSNDMKRMMKYIWILSLPLVTVSCKKYLDINENPNSPTGAPLNGLLLSATENAALNVYRVSDNVTAQYVQYLSSPNPASAGDIYEPIDASTTWTFLYDNMTNIYDLDQQAGEQGATQYQGVARILMAMDLQLVHDLWGDAPFTEAFGGEILTPAYDDAQSNYQRVLTLLDEGIALLQQAGSTVELSESADLIHEGDIDAWMKTAHALKARMLNRVSKTSQYNAANVLAEVDAAYGAGDDEAAITVFDVRNPWAEVAVDNADLLLGGWLSEHFVNAMNGTIYGIFDPRLPMITDPTGNGDYVGTRNGKGRTGSGTGNDQSVLTTTDYYSRDNSPLFIISYEEVKFIESEAAFRAGNMQRAYDAYIEGITANMDKLGVPAGQRDAYINDPSVGVGANNLTLDLIFKEKYKALFLSPETWNDARRYNYMYEDFQLPLNAAIPNFIRRVMYPNVETSRNNANVPSVAGVDERLWWDE